MTGQADAFAQAAARSKELGRQLLQEIRFSNPDRQIIQGLIEAGAALNEKDAKDLTALMWAAMDGHLDLVRLLVEAGAAVDEQGGTFGWSPLFFAVVGDHPDVCRYLLDHGASVGIKDDDGDLPLDKARALSGHRVVTMIEKASEEQVRENECVWQEGVSMEGKLLKPLRPGGRKSTGVGK